MSARVALGLWAAFALVVCVAKASSVPPPGDVFVLYHDAGRAWVRGAPLFDGTGNAFNYLPTAALPFVPLGLLPYGVAAFFWRALSVALFAFGTWSLARASRAPGAPDPFALATPFAIALAWSAARHGQMTMAMSATLLAGVAALARERWWLAAALLVTSLALKPIGFVLAAIAFLAYPRVRLPLLAAGLGVALLPFLCQRPSYVWQLYRDTPAMLELVAARADAPGHAFAQLYALLATVGLRLGDVGETVLRFALVLGVLALCLRARRRLSAHAFVPAFLVLAVTTTLVLSPVTERNTYALMAPGLGVLAARAWHERRRAAFALLVGVALLALASRAGLRHHPGTPLAYLKPVAALVLGGYAATRLARADEPDEVPA